MGNGYINNPQSKTNKQTMKHLLIILSILLLSSPVIGQSSKYESVGQCVLQTMEERELTGNKMFEMVKVECEKHFKQLKKRKGVLFFINRDRKLGWYKKGDREKDGKYVGEIKNRKPNGQGTHTYSNGEKYVGEWKGGMPWIGTKYNNNGKILGKWINGKLQ